MMEMMAQAGTPPPGVVAQVVSWIADPKTAVGSGMMIVMMVLFYMVFPSVRQAVNSLLKRQEKKQDQSFTMEQTFSGWLMKRTDQLEEERERRVDKVESENTELKDRLNGLEKDIRIQIVRHEETQQRLRNLEWIFLGEICDELIERVNKQKEEIANRLKEVGQEELANSVKKEFEKLIEDVRDSFLVRNMERTKEFMETKHLFERTSSDSDRPSKG